MHVSSSIQLHRYFGQGEPNDDGIDELSELFSLVFDADIQTDLTWV